MISFKVIASQNNLHFEIKIIFVITLKIEEQLKKKNFRRKIIIENLRRKIK